MGIADGIKSITEDIIASHDSRVKETRGRVRDVQKTLHNFATDRKNMGAGQAKALADYVETLKSDVTDLRKGFQKDLAAMAAGIRETLARGEADRMKDFKAMLGNIQKGIKDIEAYVKQLLGEYSSEMAKAKAAWQGMAASMSESRNAGVMPRIEAEEKVTTVEEAVEKKSKTRGRKKGKKNK